MKTNISLLIFFLFACAQLQGQYRFTSLGTGDGLPHDKIICIRQDESGFIWIGMRDGIARYDGSDLKVIRPEHARETSRVDNHIVSIFPSENGNTAIRCHINVGICILSIEHQKQAHRC